MEQTVVKQEPTAEAAVTPTRETAQKPKIKSPASKKRRKWIKRLIILAVLAALVVFLFKSCSGTGSIMAAGSYIPAVAARQELLVSVSGTGTIEPIHSYKVTTLVKGEVLEAPFEEGQTVHKGDLLFRIDSKDVEASIRQAELSLESASTTASSSRTSPTARKTPPSRQPPPAWSPSCMWTRGTWCRRAHPSPTSWTGTT